MERHKSTVLSATIATAVDSDTGDFIMFLVDNIGGPIVTGKTKEEAAEKMKKAFRLFLIMRSIVESNDEIDNSVKNKTERDKEVYKEFEENLQKLVA